jgi:hypothetical protein
MGFHTPDIHYLHLIRCKKSALNILTSAIIIYMKSYVLRRLNFEGSENPADLFTKNLGRIKFQKFREQLGLEFYSS